MSRTSRPWEALAVASLLLVPWSILTYGGRSVTLLFAWGLLTPSPLHVTDVYSYFFVFTVGLPDWILAWGVGIASFVVAVASAASGAIRGREDRRLTGGLLVLVGLVSVVVSMGFAGQPGRLGIPLGAVVAWPLAGWYLWQARRESVDTGVV